MYSKILKRFSTTPKKLNTQLFINGKFVNSVSGKTFKTFNPATESLIAEVQEADEKDVNLAINAARKAFDEGPWRKTSGYDKGRLINKLADLIERDGDEIALIESLDNGKPRHIARIGDVEAAVRCLRYYAGWADKIHGQVVPHSGPFFSYTRHEPVGVCGQVIPWNFPLLMLAWKLGPVLATGCTTIVKTAEQTPLSALKVAELIAEAGFPEGVVNILSGFGETAGRPLVRSHLVDKIAFTGSTEVGYEIMRNSHVNNLKRITLELGGKSALIVCDDANLDDAVSITQDGIFFNMGQCCSASSRVFVSEKRYDEFVSKLAEAARKRVIGDPLDSNTDQGPLVDKAQHEKYQKYIKLGKEQGAKVLAGGNIPKGKGYFVEPTVFSEVNDSMAIAKEEIFGPVISALKFKTLDEVIKRANSSNYGLAAGIVSNNSETILKLSNELRAGTIWVNTYNAVDSTTPFGGFKDSGVGRELGQYGLNNYTEIKTVVIKRDPNSIY